jgi:hypothetical protein
MGRSQYADGSGTVSVVGIAVSCTVSVADAELAKYVSFKYALCAGGPKKPEIRPV